MIDMMEYAKKIIQCLGKMAWEKLERNHKVLKLLQNLGVGALKEHPDSIYAHALVEYAVDAKSPDMAVLFADKTVKKTFQQDLEKKEQIDFKTVLFDRLHAIDKLSYLTHVYKSPTHLEPDILRFRELYEYFTLQTASPFQLKKYVTHQ